MQVAGGDVGHAASPKTSRHGSPQKQQVVIAHASGTPTFGQKTTEQADYCAAPCDTLILNGLLLLPKAACDLQHDARAQRLCRSAYCQT